MSEIMFIAPYQELAEIAEQICLGDKNTAIKVARMDEAIKIAEEAEEGGSQVIISRGVTAWMIRQSGIELPVVEVQIGGLDILRAYYQAEKIGVKVGIADIEEIILATLSMEEIVEQQIVKYTCQNEQKDIVKGVAYLKKQGVDVVIGKIAMANEAKRQGLKSVVITSGIEAVTRAIFESKRMLLVRKQEKKKAEQFKAILNFTYDGIIALDEFGRINAFNRVTEQLSGWSADQAIGKYITEVIPTASCQRLLETGSPEMGEILEIGDAKVVANRVPIIVDNIIEGVVTTFQQVDKLQKIESKVRCKMAESGHIARYHFNDIIGRSRCLQSAVALAKEFAEVDSTVLINGQTGTGKEMFAHAIHNSSHRKNEPFVAINCAAMPETLLESELFGYVEGAFTGAKKSGKAGVFEMAHRGTLFLDEVGEMSPMLQARLLRVIERGEVMRLGDNSILPVNVRLIAATHRNLSTMVENKTFREDLYYRINVLNLMVPPLKDREEDVLIIAARFLEEFCHKRGRLIPRFLQEAEDVLMHYSWPGNIRELRNSIERLIMLSKTTEISEEQVAKSILIDSSNDNRQILSQEDIIGSLEKDIILQTLTKYKGNRTETAKHLGISRTTLWRKLQTIS